MSTPLLLEDPQRFLEIVQEENRETRVQQLPTIADRVVCECLRHGLFPGPDTVPSILEEYGGDFVASSADERRRVYEYLLSYLTQLPGDAATACVPFMMLDPDSGIVSTATIDYASMVPPADDDPMSRPRDALAMVDSGQAVDPVGIIAGLLALHDPRVCALLAPVREAFSSEGVLALSQLTDGVVSKCVVSFYLDWLETTVDRRDEEGQAIFGHLTAGLQRRVTTRRVPMVIDGLRPFPVPPDPPPSSGVEMEDFAASIAERLFEIEAREEAPLLFPNVIRAFGLIPRREPS